LIPSSIYLQEIKVFPHLEQLDPQKQQRKNVPFFQIVLIFLMKVVGFIKIIDEIRDLLLTDELFMSICGFNAHQLALDYEGSAPVTREVEVVHGYGKKDTPKKYSPSLQGWPDILTCDWFNPEGSKTNTTRKGYKPVPLNAVVVKKWDNKTPPLEKQVEFVTNIDVRDPFVTFDRYDDCNLMENKLFREVK